MINLQADNIKIKSNYYDKMKFIAMILVVWAHSTRMYSGNGVVIPYCSSKILDIVTTIIYSFHMPLFIFISGGYMEYALMIWENTRIEASL